MRVAAEAEQQPITCDGRQTNCDAQGRKREVRVIIEPSAKRTY